MSGHTHYAVLGLRYDFTEEQVKKQYRLLALKYHPDKSRVSPKIFTIIGKAHEVLANRERRKRYAPEKSSRAWKTYRREHAASFRPGARSSAAAARNMAAPA